MEGPPAVSQLSSLIANSEQSTSLLTDGAFKRDINIASIDSQMMILCERLLLIGEIHDAVRMGCRPMQNAEEIERLLSCLCNQLLAALLSIQL